MNLVTTINNKGSMDDHIQTKKEKLKQHYKPYSTKQATKTSTN